LYFQELARGFRCSFGKTKGLWVRNRTHWGYGRGVDRYPLGGEGGGGEIHGPKHQAGGGEIDTAGVHDAEDFGTVRGEFAQVHRHAEPREGGKAAGTGHVVEAGAGVEVMAAAGASSDGGTATVAAVKESMATERDDQGLVHGDLCGVIESG
jgi:hypothetical protein